MTETNLRELFEDAVRHQPSGPPVDILVDADVARGRHRRRTIRIRWATGVAVLAAVCVAVPVLLPLASVDDAPVEPSGDGQVLTDAKMAVVDALPEDVTLLGDGADSATGGLATSWQLERTGTRFELLVAVDGARPGSYPNDLCAAPPYSPDPQVDDGCVSGRDGEGRWSLLAMNPEIGGDSVVVLDGGSASVLTRWRTVQPGPDEVSSVLTGDEALAIADAVWDVASQRGVEDLVSGIDLDGVVAIEQDMVAVVGDVLGLSLTVDGAGDPLAGGGDGNESFGYRLSLVSAEDVKVVVEVYQRERLDHERCADGWEDYAYRCTPGPERDTRSSSSSGDGDASAAVGEMASTGVGVRGGVAISLVGADGTVLERLGEAVSELAALIPQTGAGDRETEP